MATPPPSGVYTPLTAFFNEDESLDLTALKQHIIRLAQGGVTGLVVQGKQTWTPGNET